MHKTLKSATVTCFFASKSNLLGFLHRSEKCNMLVSLLPEFHYLCFNMPSFADRRMLDVFFTSDFRCKISQKILDNVHTTYTVRKDACSGKPKNYANYCTIVHDTTRITVVNDFPIFASYHELLYTSNSCSTYLGFPTNFHFFSCSVYNIHVVYTVGAESISRAESISFSNLT